MKFSALTLKLILLSSALATPTPKKKPPVQDFGNKDAWREIFSDTFNGDPPLEKPNPGRWKAGTGSYYSPGEENTNTKYVDLPTTIQISDHHSLLLKPQRGPSFANDGMWWSGKVETTRDFQAQPAKKTLFEAMIKIGDATTDKLAGIWPRFYVLSTDFWKDATTWPRMGEWEILELKNGVESFVPMLHCGEYNKGGPCKEPEGFNPGAAYTVSRGQWHRVGVEIDRSMCSRNEESECWREEIVTWLLDDQARYKIKGANLGDKDAWNRLFHQKVFMGLGVGVGGSRVGPPKNQTVEGESAGMDIDYVGVWESKYAF